MDNVVLTIHLIISLCLIAIVLFQRSEGGGLGIGGGGGGAMTGRPGISPLGKLTWIFGIAFVITSITLSILAGQNATGSSVLDTGSDAQPTQQEVPADDPLLPPVLPGSDDTSLTPPRADE